MVLSLNIFVEGGKKNEYIFESIYIYILDVEYSRKYKEYINIYFFGFREMLFFCVK